MSLKSLFGKKSAALLRKDMSANDLARELYNIFNSTDPIEMREPLRLRSYGSNPAIEIIEEDATTATIRISKYLPGETAQETALSSSGLRNESGDLATVLTAHAPYAEAEPDAKTEVLGTGNKNNIRFVTAVNEAGARVTIGGPGAAGNFAGFERYSGFAEGIIRPFTLNGDLTAGENSASAAMLRWDPVGLAFEATGHNFTLWGHFLPASRVTGDEVMAIFDPYSERFFAIA